MSAEAHQLEDTVIPRLETLYNAGQVRRMHTVPTIAHHSIAQHVYGSLLLAVEICRAAKIDPKNVMLALLVHDAPEVMTGDVPAPAKRRFGNLKIALDGAENFFYEKLGIEGQLLNPEERQIIKVCDCLDLMFNTLHEKRLGNNYPDIDIMMRNARKYVQENIEVPLVREIHDYLVMEYEYASK
jgi:5'-deoxynucleotidase YfbR-like HD superfamily hydrolase